MKAHLISTPYYDKNHDRRKELEQCYMQNMNAGFNLISYVVENKDFSYINDFLNGLRFNIFHNGGSISIVRTENRPSFQDYITQANTIEDPEMIHMVCNSDIYIETEDLEKIKSLPWDQKLFVALSRWDHGKERGLILLDRQDSADTWFWKGNCSIEGAKCQCGNPGIDNNLAWKAKDAGYKVVNPSRDIQTKHLHLVLGNNYRQDSNPNGAVIASQICPEPYYFHPPIHIAEI